MTAAERYERLRLRILGRAVRHGIGAVTSTLVAVRNDAGCPDARKRSLVTPCQQRALEGLAGQLNGG